jgi:hypothetical protein
MLFMLHVDMPFYIYFWKMLAKAGQHLLSKDYMRIVFFLAYQFYEQMYVFISVTDNLIHLMRILSKHTNSTPN